MNKDKQQQSTRDKGYLIRSIAVLVMINVRCAFLNADL